MKISGNITFCNAHCHGRNHSCVSIQYNCTLAHKTLLKYLAWVYNLETYGEINWQADRQTKDCSTPAMFCQSGALRRPAARSSALTLQLCFQFKPLCPVSSSPSITVVFMHSSINTADISRLTSSATLWEDSCQIPKQYPCGIKIDRASLHCVLMAQSGTLTGVVFGGSESSWWLGVWGCSSTTDESVTSPSVLCHSCSCLVWHRAFGDHLNLVHLLFVLFDPN